MASSLCARAAATLLSACWLGPREGTNLAKPNEWPAMENQCSCLLADRTGRRHTWSTPPKRRALSSTMAGFGRRCQAWECRKFWVIVTSSADARWNMPWRFSRVTWCVEQEKAGLLLLWQSGFWLQNDPLGRRRGCGWKAGRGSEAIAREWAIRGISLDF